MTEVTEAFVSAAKRHHSVTQVVPADQLSDALDAAVIHPAVGVPLDDFSLDLDSKGITTEPTTSNIQVAATGVTPAACGLADYGSILIESHESAADPVSLFADRHVAVLAASDIHTSIEQGIESVDASIRSNGGDYVIATGPSATADMGALVHGAHGPRAVHVIVVEDT